MNKFVIVPKQLGPNDRDGSIVRAFIMTENAFFCSLSRSVLDRESLMKTRAQLIFILTVWGIAALGCSVTEDKISLWKTTRKGPQKIADVISDDAISNDLRSAATLALIEIKQHALLNTAFESLSAEDADALVSATIPKLAVLIRGGSEDAGTLTSTQISAINGAYLLYSFAGPQSRQPVEKELISWCTEGDFRLRERAGFNIRVIINKVGSPAYMALIKRLRIDEPAIEKIAQIIMESEDATILSKASVEIVTELKNKPEKIAGTHLKAAGIIGGSAVADFLVSLVSDSGQSAQLRDFALLVYSTALENKKLNATNAHAVHLVAVAEDAAQDKKIRENIYLTLAQMTFPAATDSLTRLLVSDDFFWRMVGARCLFRQSGDKQLLTVLQTKKIATDSQEISELVSMIARFPKLKIALISTLAGTDNFSVGIAVAALGILGNAKDIPHLEKIKGNRGRLPAGFSAKTVGAAASDAILAIEKKG